MTALAPAPVLAPVAGRARAWRRVHTVGLVLGVIALALVLVNLAMGTVSVGFGDALRAALGIETGTKADFIVGTVRAPRVATAALVGALLATSGALMQSVARNPLASPDLLGISAGASAGAVAFMLVAGIGSTLAIAPFAVLGALLSAGLVLTLGSRRGLHPARMIIAGIGLTFVFQSVVTWALTRLPEQLVPHAYAWTIGSTNARNGDHVLLAAASVAVVVPVALLLLRAVRTLELGDDLAAGLGVRVNRTRLATMLVAAAAAGLAAALVGPVAFIALVAPALARALVGTGGITLWPSVFMGVSLTLLADFLARELFSPDQLPIGLLTAVVGGPYLIYLLVRAKGAFQ